MSERGRRALAGALLGDGYLPVFEAAAEQTRGAAAAPVAARIGAKLRALGGDALSASDWQKIFGFGGKVVGAAVAIALAGLFSRKRRKALPVEGEPQ